MVQSTLLERFENWNEDLSIDPENGLVLNVVLAGQFSRNGYQYTEEALRNAAGFYEGKPVFLDHAQVRQRPQERSTRDLVGSIANPRFVAGRIRGDIRVLQTESGQMFLRLVESQTPGVGMSHVVLAERSADGKSVEKIVDVISVDVVMNPATTSTFSESSAPLANDVNTQDLPEETLQRLESTRAERDALLTENQMLRKQIKQLTTQDEVRQQIARSGLPSEAISECFHRQLLDANSPAVREQLLSDRLQLLSSSRREFPRTVSLPRRPSSSRVAVEDEFIRTLKRR